MKNTDRNKVGLLYFLWIASTAAWFPMINLYFEKSGFNGVQVGLLASIIPMVMLLGQPFVSLIADKYGRRKVLFLILLIAAFVIYAFLVKGSFLFYFIVTVLFAFCFTPINPLVDSIVLDFVDQSQNTSYSRLRMFGSIGWMTCAYLTGLVVNDQSLGSIFIIGSILMAITALVSLTIKKEVTTIDEQPIKYKDVKQVVANPAILIFLIVLVLFGIGSTPINTFYSIYLNKIGASSKLIGLSFAIQALSELPFLFYASKLVKQYGSLKVITVAILFSGFRILSYTQITNPYIALSLDISNGICYSLFLVGAVEYINGIVPVKLRATGQSLIWAAYIGAGTLVGNLATGFFYEKWSIQTAFFIDALILFVAALLPLFLIKKNFKKKSIAPLAWESNGNEIVQCSTSNCKI